ncbi:MAG: hypothetical protein C0467_14025 [Planctomycetaceae bacterium]|nr:hypothetical protein [Planctomycetaceae bacterium]
MILLASKLMGQWMVLPTFADITPGIGAVLTVGSFVLAGYFLSGAAIFGGIWFAIRLRGGKGPYTKKWFFTLLGWAFCLSSPAVAVYGVEVVAESFFEAVISVVLGVAMLLAGIRLRREGREPLSEGQHN